MPSLPAIAVFGGAHFDYVGQLATPFQQGQSHPGHWESHLGGVACNIARHLAHFGHDVPFATCLGSDATAERLLSDLTEYGLSVNPAQIVEGASPSYTVMHDQNGNVLVGLADMDAYARMDEAWANAAAERAQDADIWLLDSNLQDAAVARLCTLKAHRWLIAAPVSPAKTEVLRSHIIRLDGLICNLAEAEALLERSLPDTQTAAEALHVLGPQLVAITNGDQLATLALKDQRTATATPPPLTRDRHLTGAGDAFAAALCSSLARGDREPTVLLQRGLNASYLTAQASESCPRLSWADIDATHS